MKRIEDVTLLYEISETLNEHLDLKKSLYTVLDILKVNVNRLNIRIKNPVFKWLIFFLIGVYGGFIQIGVGILMLIGIRQTFGFDWSKANFFKLWIILIYTIPTTIYFGYIGMIIWVPGIILAVGQLISAFFTGWLFTISERTRNSIPYVVLVMLLITAAKIVFF